MANTFTSLTYHIIFSTKGRRPVITPTYADELHKYIGGILSANHGQPLIINGVEDHVHILTGIAATVSVSDTVRLIKTNSSKWAREHHRKDFAWQTGFSAFTVSHSRKETVRRYFENQQEHHRNNTFKEEYLMFLKKHGIEFKMKYVFDEEHVG